MNEEITHLKLKLGEWKLPIVLVFNMYVYLNNSYKHVTANLFTANFKPIQLVYPIAEQIFYFLWFRENTFNFVGKVEYLIKVHMCLQKFNSNNHFNLRVQTRRFPRIFGIRDVCVTCVYHDVRFALSLTTCGEDVYTTPTSPYRTTSQSTLRTGN